MNNYMNDIYEGIIITYGIQRLTLKEELDLPKYAKQTRQNKMKIIDTCKYIEDLTETIKSRAKKAPELDDPKHAALVQELSDKVNEACKAIEDAWRVGYR